MASKSRIATGWESRHFGNCFVDRTHEGWVVSLAHSGGITGPTDFLVPFLAADGRKRRPVAARLKRMLQAMIADLGNVRRVSQTEASRLLRVPHLGPLWRRNVRWYPPGFGNWNGRGRICPSRGHSGFSYLTARTDRGWLVLFRSLWGTPCGSYIVPFDMLPFRAGKWDPEFFVRPIRWHVTHLQGTKKLSPEEAARTKCLFDEEMSPVDEAA
jgi:hypothetical protein